MQAARGREPNSCGFHTGVGLQDLSHVLSLLRGPPFEPLSSCPLRELIRKVLFLLALATARRVSEFHAVSSVVSFSAGDVYLSFLPVSG